MLIAIIDSDAGFDRAVSRGATHMIFRAPQLGTGAQLGELRQLIRRSSLPILAHSRVDLALAAGAAGLHLPELDIPVVDARRLLARPTLIGRSTHTAAAVERAAAEGADYVLYGPVYPTPSHPGHPGLGIDALAMVARRSAIPVVAIGGVDAARGAECLAAGAGGYAAIRAFSA